MKKGFFIILFLITWKFLFSQDLASIPSNKWIKLEGKFPSGYNYSKIEYAEVQDALIHWGAVKYSNGVKDGRNDVRRFNMKNGLWESDYPSDEKISWGITGGGSGGAISYTGFGSMTTNNHPYAAMTVNAATYDSKRKIIIYAMTGLMVSYDPVKKSWQNMNAKTILNGKTFDGAPQVYGAAMCYDPINDEIVLFSHFGAQNVDRRDISGRITGHFGTMIYSYKTNSWKRVGNELGSLETKKLRNEILLIEKNLSPAIDNLWALQIKPDAKLLSSSIDSIKGSLTSLINLKGIDQQLLKEPKKCLEECLDDAAQNKLNSAEFNGGKVFLLLDQLLENELAVEPPARAVAPLIYDSKNQSIVLFGGDNNHSRRDLSLPENFEFSKKMNDTWVYHCKTKQWEEISTNKRPPNEQSPNFFYDPKSGLCVLVVINGDRYNKKIPRRISIWTLNIISKEWKLMQEDDWDGEITDWVSIGFDSKASTIVLTQTENIEQSTWVMKLDINSIKGMATPENKISPKIKPIIFPKDDELWVKKLIELPENTWDLAKPKNNTSNRGWGNIAVDPISGNLFYFGGGHSSYQGSDVATYVTGCNEWIGQAGDQNDSLPAVGWGGFFLGLHGAPNAVHQRNSYVALNNRVYQNTGLDHPLAHLAHHVKRGNGKRFYKDAYFASYSDAPYTWVYDTSRGGVWRQLPTKISGDFDKIKNKNGEINPTISGRPHMVGTDGKIYGIDFNKSSLQDSKAQDIVIHIFDSITNILEIKTTPMLDVEIPPEGRGFCLLNNKNKIFYQFYGSKTQKALGTYIYDIAENKFTNLNVPQPEGVKCLGAVYLEDQNAVFAVMAYNFEQSGNRIWIYSFESNTWRIQDQIPNIPYAMPYLQMEYSHKYGVLVNTTGDNTWVMRPNVSKMK